VGHGGPVNTSPVVERASSSSSLRATQQGEYLLMVETIPSLTQEKSHSRGTQGDIRDHSMM